MGLPVYSKNGKPELCRGKFHRYYNLQKLQNSILKPATIKKYFLDECDSGKNILPNHSFEVNEKAKTKALEKLTKSQKDKYLKTEKEMLAIYEDDPSLHSWKYFDSDPYCDGEIDDLLTDLKNCLFKVEEIREFLRIHNIEPIKFDFGMKKSTKVEEFPKGLRYSQKIRKKCREIAATIWKKEKITIAEMCRRREIKDVAINKNGKPYKERTIRNWIKDLAPDHSPGRRPK